MRTCLDCGFLTIRTREVTQAQRVMLASRGESAAMPTHSEQTDCFRNLWVEYDLNYWEPSLEGVFDELKRSRDKCVGFFPYESGFTPAQHLERQEGRRREKLQWRIARLGFFGALLGALIGSVLPSLWRWLERLVVHRH
jgi:hypothetical protein